MVGAGMIAGVAAALAMTRLMRGILFEVPATDVATYAIAIGVLVVVSLLASWLPARQAARVDPMTAMRAE
jgi:ABC-type antimicrobial peptide transport system permease subunit